jgi:hypothetical protein
MTATRKTLLGAAAALTALGVAGAGSASAFSWGESTPSGSARSVTLPSSDSSLNFTREVMQDFH